MLSIYSTRYFNLFSFIVYNNQENATNDILHLTYID